MLNDGGAEIMAATPGGVGKTLEESSFDDDTATTGEDCVTRGGRVAGYGQQRRRCE